MYSDTLRLLWDEVRMKCPEKESTNLWSLLYDNAPAHRPVFVRGLLSKSNVTTQEHNPYSPALAIADFYLFPLLKSTLKGRCFCDAIDIMKNATEELKRL